MRNTTRVLSVLGTFFSILGAARAAAPILPPISKGPVHVQLEPVAAGLVSPADLTPAGDGTSRLFVGDQNGQVRLIDGGTLLAQPFLDVSSRLVTLSPGYDERGLLGLAFDPGYADPASPGVRKLYTYTSEPVAGPADFTVPMPPATAFNHQSVIAEWQVSAADPNVVDMASRREIMRIDEPQSNHNGGKLAFGPDGDLYVSLGDGGRANDVGNGHTATIGNGQDTSNVLGKILRIDVRGSNSANHQYGIPSSNPFVSGGGVAEIYAYGLRNPFRFSFDRANGQLIAADVGQNNVEELDRIVSGGNYGWHYKEGTFKFNPADGSVSTDLTGLPPGLIDPLAEYDHTQGNAVIGGFVYRGTRIPQLVGSYVFGDLGGFPPTSNSGRLFYANLDTGLIQELVLDPVDQPLGKYIKGFGEGANGELYLLTSGNLGPSGTAGAVYALVPEPSALALLGIAAISLLAYGWQRRKRAL